MPASERIGEYVSVRLSKSVEVLIVTTNLFKEAKKHPNWAKADPFTLEDIERRLIQNQVMGDFRYAKLIDELRDRLEIYESCMEYIAGVLEKARSE